MPLPASTAPVASVADADMGWASRGAGIGILPQPAAHAVADVEFLGADASSVVESDVWRMSAACVASGAASGVGRISVAARSGVANALVGVGVGVGVGVDADADAGASVAGRGA